MRGVWKGDCRIGNIGTGASDEGAVRVWPFARKSLEWSDTVLGAQYEIQGVPVGIILP